jgi:GNAT superfamily N-acetyltransferase
MPWDTDFFARRFGRLEIDAKEKERCNPRDLENALKDVLSFGDQKGFDIIEARLDVSWIHHMVLFETNGFRLVDTKIRFITSKEKSELKTMPKVEGELVFASKDMKEEILALTCSAFAENPSFKSRFNNRRYFSRSDTERYYAAWIENYIGDENSLFGVMKDEGKIVGYLVYAKIGEHAGRPLYKGALTAVAPEHRGKGINLALRSFIYRHLPKAQIYLDQTTQLTNTSMIKSLIGAKSHLESIELVFYRRREDGLAANPA